MQPSSFLHLCILSRRPCHCGINSGNRENKKTAPNRDTAQWNAHSEMSIAQSQLRCLSVSSSSAHRFDGDRKTGQFPGCPIRGQNAFLGAAHNHRLRFDESRLGGISVAAGNCLFDELDGRPDPGQTGAINCGTPLDLTNTFLGRMMVGHAIAH